MAPIKSRPLGKDPGMEQVQCRPQPAPGNEKSSEGTEWLLALRSPWHRVRHPDHDSTATTTLDVFIASDTDGKCQASVYGSVE